MRFTGAHRERIPVRTLDARSVAGHAVPSPTPHIAVAPGRNVAGLGSVERAAAANVRALDQALPGTVLRATGQSPGVGRVRAGPPRTVVNPSPRDPPALMTLVVTVACRAQHWASQARRDQRRLVCGH